MKYKTIKNAKAFFSEMERQGRVRLGPGMGLLGVFNTVNLYAWPSAFTYTTTSIFWGNEAEGDKRTGDFTP